ncbi:hypothetical protein A2U01_0105080, partial [Trifolium medium]|nr:hypothetical protein [Trifolium medium]
MVSHGHYDDEREDLVWDTSR